MKLKNNSKNKLIFQRYQFPIGADIEVPVEIANIWLKYSGVEEIKEKEVVTTKKTTTKKK